MNASWQIWSIDFKETFSRDVAHIIGLHLNILTPVPDVLTDLCNLHVTCKNLASYLTDRCAGLYTLKLN